MSKEFKFVPEKFEFCCLQCQKFQCVEIEMAIRLGWKFTLIVSTFIDFDNKKVIPRLGNPETGCLFEDVLCYECFSGDQKQAAKERLKQKILEAEEAVTGAIDFLKDMKKKLKAIDKNSSKINITPEIIAEYERRNREFGSPKNGEVNTYLAPNYPGELSVENEKELKKGPVCGHGKTSYFELNCKICIEKIMSQVAMQDLFWKQ